MSIIDRRRYEQATYFGLGVILFASVARLGYEAYKLLRS